jgi:DNA processing protein
VPRLVEQDWEIISGGAAGVDCMAHKETLDCGGKTIAVFGSGLLHAYPTENKSLFRSIVQNNGILVSPFPLNAQPSKWNFPARNRIISGLSQGCLVVQAAKKSGALITAQFGLDQGKQIFALPGLIDNELSAGCHKLIQQGAKLVTDVCDILEEFGEKIVIKEPPYAKATGGKEKPADKKPTDPILKHITTPISIDELSNKTSLDLSELQNKLFMLQIEGKIRQNIVGLWESI